MEIHSKHYKLGGLVYPLAPYPGNGQTMALLWPKHGPSSCFFLNLNQCAGDVPCHVSHCLEYSVAPFLEIAETWPFYDQNSPHMVLQIGSS